MTVKYKTNYSPVIDVGIFIMYVWRCYAVFDSNIAFIAGFILCIL